MRELYIEALERAKVDKAELRDMYFYLAVEAGKKDEKRAEELLRVALDQMQIVEGIERNIHRLKEGV